jgi:hypothetical protein
LYKHSDIHAKNFKDTFLASKLITAGLKSTKEFIMVVVSTASIWCRSFSKASQTSFTGREICVGATMSLWNDLYGKLLEAL